MTGNFIALVEDPDTGQVNAVTGWRNSEEFVSKCQNAMTGRSATVEVYRKPSPDAEDGTISSCYNVYSEGNYIKRNNERYQQIKAEEEAA